MATWALHTVGSLRPSAHGDIYQWEWIDPSDHSLGRQQSTTLAPDGDGRSAVPNAYLVDLDLTKAWLQAHDLHQAWFVNTTLTHADLSNADLTGAFFGFTTLRDANFSNAEIRGAWSASNVPPCRAAIRTGASRLSSSIRPRATRQATCVESYSPVFPWSGQTVCYQVGIFPGRTFRIPISLGPT